MIKNTKLIVETANGSLVKYPVTLQFVKGRIEFLEAPYALKDEIKAMKSYKWHGYDDPPRKIWSVEDCPRNQFQLSYLEGENVYQWFDRPVERRDYHRPLMPHQRDLADWGLTYHFQIFAAEMGVGKTLAAQEVIERSGHKHWFWVGPKSSIPNIKREFRRWGFDESIVVDWLTYEGMTKWVDQWNPGDPVPFGVIFDESSKLKTPTAQRTLAAQALADKIREVHGLQGFVILMSGTPSPKRPTDWWAQCEIAWPGFPREGSVKSLEQRLAFLVKKSYGSGSFLEPVGWKDNENKCLVCGRLHDEGPHEIGFEGGDFHRFKPSKNEVAYMFERLKGLVVVKHKKDCLNLPDKHYRVIRCEPSASVLRVAQAIAKSAPNIITAATLLRELSDGFQYRDIDDGEITCPHCDGTGTVEEWFDPDNEDRTFSQTDLLSPELTAKLVKREVDCPRCKGAGQVTKKKRIAREVPCPKEAALKELLEENEEPGRIVIFAGFTGSVDRCVKICQKEGWAVVRCDGRGFEVTTAKGEVLNGVEALDYWADLESNPLVAFVAHPESGGMSLTLVEARMAVYWSNSFKPEYRSQSEDRIHRKGMDLNLGCTIVDLIHLPTDERVIDVLRENRRLELMSMGDFTETLAA